MSFQPKKRIPSIAAAGLALVGCGDDSQFEQAAGRIDRLDPRVTAFCMKFVECYPDGFIIDDLDSCRLFVLGYLDAYSVVSDDPGACIAAAFSYMECFNDVPCQTAGVSCLDVTEAYEAACFPTEEETP